MESFFQIWQWGWILNTPGWNMVCNWSQNFKWSLSFYFSFKCMWNNEFIFPTWAVVMPWPSELLFFFILVKYELFIEQLLFSNILGIFFWVTSNVLRYVFETLSHHIRQYVRWLSTKESYTILISPLSTSKLGTIVRIKLSFASFRSNKSHYLK